MGLQTSCTPLLICTSIRQLGTNGAGSSYQKGVKPAWNCSMITASATSIACLAGCHLMASSLFWGTQRHQYICPVCSAFDTVIENCTSKQHSPLSEPLVHVCRPALRTSHQTVLLKQYLYVFGGELTSLNQVCKFIQHLFWQLPLRTRYILPMPLPPDVLLPL